MRTMNAEWKEEGLVVPSSSFDEQALPHRTVSFAPKPQIRQPNIAEREPTNFSIRHPSASFSVDLPRVLQAGIRPDTIACRGVRQGQSKATPRQLALGGEGVLGTDRHERDMHFGVPLIQGEEAHTHLKRLDEKMEKIATGGKWNNLCVPSQATLGYVATMRRQQFANAYISFRHPQRGLSRNAVMTRPRPLHHRGVSVSLKLELEKRAENSQEGATTRSKSLRQKALES